MDALMEYSKVTFSKKNGDKQESGTIFKKSKTAFMTFETGFSVK
jgi:hypothetical protein